LAFHHGVSASMRASSLAARSWCTLAMLGALAWPAAARAEDEAAREKDSNTRTVSSVGQARVVGVVGLSRGSELVDLGSRAPVQTATLTTEMEVTNTPAPVGIDLALAFGLVGVPQHSGRTYWGRFELAAVGAAFQRDGARGGSLVLGTGLGTSFGDRYWWEDLRAYPYTLVRATYLFDRRASASLTWTCAPVDTASVDKGLWAMENRVEAAFGFGLFAAGLRATASTVVGGDPQRLYGDFEFAFFLGMGVRFAPVDKRSR
jgi:hypothetical protein